MSPRPRPTFALALAATLSAGGIGATTSAPVGAQEEDDTVTRCYTQALTLEEVAAGATSEIYGCHEVDPDEPVTLGRSATFVAAMLYDGFNGAGAQLTVEANACDGHVVSFPSWHWWNDRVSSTDLWSCGTAKHFVDAGSGGAYQTVTGGGLHNMNGTLNNQTTTIEYAS